MWGESWTLYSGYLRLPAVTMLSFQRACLDHDYLIIKAFKTPPNFGVLAALFCSIFSCFWGSFLIGTILIWPVFGHPKDAKETT